MSVTQKQLAELLGISRQLVGHALTGHPGVSEVTRQRIQSLADKMGYRPNQFASALVSGRTQTIALWIAGAYTPHYLRIVQSLEKIVAETEYTMIVSDLGGFDSRNNPKNSPNRNHWPVTGVIVVDAPGYARTYLQANPMSQTSCVTIGAFTSDEADSVKVDLYPGVIEAMRHLVSLGHRNIIHFTPIKEEEEAEVRARGYREVMQESGLQPKFLSLPDQQRATARRRIVEHVKESGCPDAIFCHNDEIAIGTYRGLCDLKISVPDQVALVGCDGIEDTEYLGCSLTTIEQPVEEMCRLAWDYFEKRLERPKSRIQRSILKAKLTIRESTARA